MLTLKGSVGRTGKNDVEDVALVQQLLNLGSKTPAGKIGVDGRNGTNTEAAIERFQRDVVKLAKPDAKVDPGGRTFNALLQAALPTLSERTKLPNAVGTRGLSDQDFARAAETLDCSVPAIKAVAEVEARGDGFLADGRPKILFEAHVFSRFTKHVYDRCFPSISSHSWNRALYKGNAEEYERMLKAAILDRESALKAASWGRFQVMGFNHLVVGHPTVEGFVTAMFQSEGKHLDAFVGFVQKNGLGTALKNKEWAKFAKAYNGDSYAENKYDVKIGEAYTKYGGK